MTDLTFLKDRHAVKHYISAALLDVPRLLQLLNENRTLTDKEIAKLWGYSAASAAIYRREATKAMQEGFKGWEEYVKAGRPFKLSNSSEVIVPAKGKGKHEKNRKNR